MQFIQQQITLFWSDSESISACLDYIGQGSLTAIFTWGIVHTGQPVSMFVTGTAMPLKTIQYAYSFGRVVVTDY